jgi:DNA-binding MarR family transcriptional regulator
MSEMRPSYLVGRADRILRSQLEEMLSHTRVSLPELTALSVLAARPGLSNARLARRSLVTPQGMHKVMKSLEQQGLVRRRAAGGRMLGAETTAKGRAILTKLEPLRRDVESEFLGVLDSDEREEFVRILAKLCERSHSPGSE